jgi:hypothetical protein
VDHFAESGTVPALKRIALLPRPAAWRDSDSVCALADDWRHMGHIVRAGNCWLAFDGTHSNETGTGFRLLGSWKEVTAAKRALELELARVGNRVPRLH